MTIYSENRFRWVRADFPAQQRLWLIRKLTALLCVGSLGIAVGGCSLVSRSVIQGTDHGSPSVVVPPGAQYELLTLQTKDGVKIAAQFGRALTENDSFRTDYSSRPTVIYCYPGGYTLHRSQKQFDGFRRLGMNVIVPEYPGFGMSDGRPSEAGCYAAVDAAYAYVLGRSDLEHRKIYAAGWSVGGGAAMDLASREPLAGLLIISTSTNLGEVVRGMADRSTKWSWVPNWLVKVLVSGCKLDSWEKIHSVACPIMLIYGTEDELVPVAMTDRLSAAARVKVTRYPVIGARHTDVFNVGGAPLWQAMSAWIEAESKGHALANGSEAGAELTAEIK